MECFIRDENHKYDDKDFLDEVVKFMFTYGMSLYDGKKLILKEKYVNDLPDYKSLTRKYIPLSEVVISGLKNIKWRRGVDNIIHFEINFNEKIYGTNAKLYEVCKLVNYGTFGLHPYPIFTDTFVYVKMHIDDLKLIYDEVGEL